MQELGIFEDWAQVQQSYEQIRQSWGTEHRRFFELDKIHTDVLRFSQETHITKNYDHPTKKPEKLTSVFIQTCSREDDFVFVPFAGSGTECAIAARYGRRFLGFDIEPKYVKMANKRVGQELSKLKLFY